MLCRYTAETGAMSKMVPALSIKRLWIVPSHGRFIVAAQVITALSPAFITSGEMDAL